MPLTLALLVSSSAALAQPSPRQSAEQLARKGQVSKAIDLLRKAEPSLDAEGHYLLGALLAVERRRGHICEADAYRGEIVGQLMASLEGGESFKERALKDPRFAVIHDTLGWQRMRSLVPERTTDIPLLLSRVTFFGPSQGMYGSTAELHFTSRGRLRGWQNVWDEKADMPRRRSIEGTYQIDARKVTLRLGGGVVWQGELREDGLLAIEGQGEFRDEPSECDA